jgi:ABC-type uncharacterized transport system permease subunit
MMNLPAQVIMGKAQINLILTAFAIALGSLTLSMLLWKKAVQHYQSWGG